LSRADLVDFQNRAKGVLVPDEVLALLEDLRKWCGEEKITVSDRRWWKVVKLLKTSALANGNDAVSIWDCWLLQHCLWSDNQQREKVYEWYASRVGAAAAKPAQIVRFLNVWEKKLNHDKSQRVQLIDAKGAGLYKDRAGEHTTCEFEQKVNDAGLPLFRVSSKLIRRDNGDRDGEYTVSELDQLYVKYSSGSRFEKFKNWSGRKEYLADKDNWIVDKLEPALGPLQHHATHVDHCLAEIEGLRKDVERHKQGIEGQIASFTRDIHNHLWVC
ncbi:MAG: ATPase, partial [Betaproteobacteria bacterium]|nr:ATPase [Betaproteobacteria bacterium]